MTSSYTVLVVDSDPEFGGTSELMLYQTREEAERVAQRERDECAAYGLTGVHVSVVQVWRDL